jgi:hypothetical protein
MIVRFPHWMCPSHRSTRALAIHFNNLNLKINTQHECFEWFQKLKIYSILIKLKLIWLLCLCWMLKISNITMDFNLFYLYLKWVFISFIESYKLRLLIHSPGVHHFRSFIKFSSCQYSKLFKYQLNK